MKSLINQSVTNVILLSLCSTLTGCFVSVNEDGYDDDYYDDDYYEGELIEEEVFEEEVFEEEVFEEEVFEEVSTTTTTTTSEDLTPVADEPLIESHTVEPVESNLIFEETFESPELLSIDRVAVSSMGQWAIEWTPGSRCEHLNGTGSIEIQSETDVGDQFEVEGVQHARLDGRCGQDLNPARILTSIAEVNDAQTLVFYARVAETAPYAELMIEWNDQVVMNEPLLDVWAEYIIDLKQVQNADDAILSITALNPGVLIDHIRVE